MFVRFSKRLKRIGGVRVGIGINKRISRKKRKPAAKRPATRNTQTYQAATAPATYSFSAAPTKKPFHKRWYVWAIGVSVVLIGVVAIFGEPVEEYEVPLTTAVYATTEIETGPATTLLAAATSPPLTTAAASSAVVPVTTSVPSTPVAMITTSTVTSPAVMVWLSATGTRWHSVNNCGQMNPDRARQVALEEVRAMPGFAPCENCNPPR